MNALNCRPRRWESTQTPLNPVAAVAAGNATLPGKLDVAVISVGRRSKFNPGVEGRCPLISYVSHRRQLLHTSRYTPIKRDRVVPDPLGET